MAVNPPQDVPLQAWLETYLDEQVERAALSGVVVVVVDRTRTVASAARGLARLDPPRPVKIDDLFWIASQTKPITAMALMMLVEAQKVSLDDPIERYLPYLTDFWVTAETDADHLLLRRTDRAITLRDLLSHMSGMPFVSALERPTIDTVPLRYLVDSYRLTPLLTQPGAGYRYSNMGINTIGRVIEVATDMTYEQFLNERLFEPLGMRDTVFRPDLSQLKRLVEAVCPDAANQKYVTAKLGQLTMPFDGKSRQPVPAGGLFSTATDLARLNTMLLNAGELDGHRYLSAASIEEMTRRQTPAAVNESYGLGWSVEGTRYFHAGAAGSAMVIDPASGRALIYMIQNTGYVNGGELVRAKLERAAFEL